MKKLLPAVALGLSAAFLLTACKEETEKETTNTGPAIVAEQVTPPAAPEGTKSRLDDARFIQAVMPVRTLDGRELSVTFTAYCEKMSDLDNTRKNAAGNTEYTAACSQYVQRSLEWFATDRECFEGSIPAVHATVRNHEGLPQRADDLCHDVYPDNYAEWSVPMMRRMLEMTAEDNLYTVTKITPVAPR